MYNRWESSKVRKRTMQLLEEQLFCDLYNTLNAITTEFGEPSPAELWEEAKNRWQPLIASKRPKMAVKMLKSELIEIYGERSAFLVLMILMYMLVAMFRPTKESPYNEYCEALANATQDNQLLQRFMEGVRQTEDEEEKAGRKIGIVTSLLTDMKVSGQSIDLDTIEERILRFPTIELQQKVLEQADNILRGTAWSKRSAKVQEKIFTRYKEQQVKQEGVLNALEKAAERPTHYYGSGSIHNDNSRQMTIETQKNNEEQKKLIGNE